MIRKVEIVIQESLVAFGVSVTVPAIFDFTVHIFSVIVISIVGTTTIHYTRKFLNRNNKNKSENENH